MQRSEQKCGKCHVSKPVEKFDLRGRRDQRRKTCNDCRDKYTPDHNRRRLYGLDAEAYAILLAAQGGVCAICKQPDPLKRQLSVDHDHACCPTQKTCGRCIRGLLCFRCNTGLGGFMDNPSLLIAAADYLMVNYVA